MKPNKPLVRRYLRNAGYPAKEQELISKAVENGAPAADEADVGDAPSRGARIMKNSL